MEAIQTRELNNGFIIKVSILFLVIMIGYINRVYDLNSFFSTSKTKITSVQAAEPLKD